MSQGNKRLKRKRKEFEKSRDSDEITKEDYNLIDEFLDYDLGENKPRTVANHLLHLRKTAERSDIPLSEMNTEDVNDLLMRFQAGIHPKVKDDGIVVKNYQSALRKFYRHHDGLNVEDETNIDVEDDDYDGRDLSEQELLYRDEIDALFEAAQRRSPRDMAALATMLATGLRIDAARTLRLKHIDQDGPTMEVTLNKEEGNLKGAEGARALLWGKHYVRPWVESHPHKDNPEAALFPARTGNSNQHQSNFGTEPMADRTFRRMVRKRADEAGIDKRVYPHLLRHSAITRMAADERLNEQQIKDIAGWDRDSSQFERYVTLADDIATDSVREALGVPTSESGTPVVGQPSLERCPECNDQLREEAERCPTCNTPLTHAEAKNSELDTETQCVKCEESIRKGSEFCRHCGAYQSEEDGDSGGMQFGPELEELSDVDPEFVEEVVEQKLEEMFGDEPSALDGE